MARIVFGPVPSRRLGLSLGVDLFPEKYCTFDCMYCQIGRTRETDIARKTFVDTEEVVRQIIEAVRGVPVVDFITFSGSGEPTLSNNLGELLRRVRQTVPIPLAVITNGSLLHLKEVRDELEAADVVLPSLDAAQEETFRRINRPHTSLTLAGLVEGLKAFRMEFRGKIWLELMLLRNINNSAQELKLFKQIITSIGADKVQLNTVTRPPRDASVEGLGTLELEKIRRYFGGSCEVIGLFEGRLPVPEGQDWQTAVEAILKRRSLSLKEIAGMAGLSPSFTRKGLQVLEGKGTVRPLLFRGRLFYVYGQSPTNSVDKSGP